MKESTMTTETKETVQAPSQAAQASDNLPSWLPQLVKIGVPLILLGSALMYFHYHNRISTDDAQVDGHLAPVACRVYGSVEKVWVKDNQSVKAGDVLVTLDPRDLQAKVDQARAALAMTIAQVAQGGSDLTRSQESFAQAQGADLQGAIATLEARKASFEKAKNDLQRMKPLAERQEISALSFDAYKTQADVAENEWKAAQRKVSSLQHEADIRKTSVSGQAARNDQYKAAVDQAKANLATLELQLSYTKIVAPMDGVVTRKIVEPGQIIQAGQGLLTIIPLETTWITANFKETQLQKMRPGQEAEIKIDMNGLVIHGHVDSIAGSTGSRMSLLPPENAVGNYVKVVQRIPVKIQIDPSEAAKGYLRPGMNVEATVITK